MTLGRTLAKLRERRGLTQRSLADRLGVTVNYVSFLENDRRNPSFPMLERIADELGAKLKITLESK